MEKAFTVHLVTYAPILKTAGIKFKEDEKTLMVGKPSAEAGYVILISSRTLDAPKMLHAILPVLKKSRAAYRIIKSQHNQYRLNAGAFGEQEAGKIVTIFPNDLDEARKLVVDLDNSTGDFKGPMVIDSQRVGEVIYIQSVIQNINQEFVLGAPNLKHFPFEIKKQYRHKKNRLGLIGKAYLPVQLLRSAAKGNIYKAINLKHFRFDWCLIKQGNPVALDDHFDRDMQDRLRWQKQVHEALKGRVYTPDVVDYFTSNGFHYLVFNFAEGDSLGNVVRQELTGKQWIELCARQQETLLGYFLQAVKLVQSVHEQGFVHRDVTDSNFMLLDDGKLCIIDFELSYSLTRSEPNPPFLLGTFGYVAPEQIQHAIPDKKEDIYSLGALLCFVLTACKTWEFITPNLHQLNAKIFRLTNERQLTDLIIKCLSYNRAERPEIEFLITTVENKLITLKEKYHEKVPMAI